MADVPTIERLLKAGRARSGDRLELVADRPAVLIKGDTRLQAGNTPVTAGELGTLLDEFVERDRVVAFELGEEVRAVAQIAGEYFPFKARQAGGVFRMVLELTPVPAASQAPAPPQPAAAPSASHQTGTHKPAAPGAEVFDRPLDRMLRTLVRLGGSDLHLAARVVPMIRLHGDMKPLPGYSQPLSSEHILLMGEEIAPGKNRGEFRSDNDTDFAYEIENLARFRVNMYRDRRGVGIVLRQIPHKILSFDDLGLPDCVKTLCMLNKGLVLVTGPTGSGKSTTLATMVDYVNERRSDHIITIEDPIEFVHENKRCLVNQREVYAHTESFKRALRAALREDPDIVLVGELRDLETMAIAIETAETGHLVFGTLHTTTAISTVDRLIDQFPADRQEQVRVMLAESLKGVIAQILLKKVGGGRVAAYEILLGIPAVSNLIREAKTFQIATIMQTARRLGMRLMNDALAELVKKGIVETEEALSKAVDKDGLRGLLKLGPVDGSGGGEGL
jgi:twitching motility protein PilT